MGILKLLALVIFSTIAASAEAADRTRLTGAELADRVSGYEVLAGISAVTGESFMVVAYRNGTRDLYWNDGLKLGTDSGTHRFTADQTCVVWQNTFNGEERCYDVYRLDDNRFESWHNGTLAYSYYKIR